jgi:glycosyltransferase involved in cell wall biosynthesis
MNRPPIVLVAGHDPSAHSGGHPSYVIAHALAAADAGFSPQVFCASARSERLPMEYGTLWRVASPMPHGYRSEPVQRPFLARAVARYLAGLKEPGPHILHSFGAWAASGAAVARMVAPRGISTIPIASAFTTLAHENRAKVLALAPEHGLSARLHYHRDYLWVRAVASRAEHRGYRESALVLVNYESVRRLVLDACHPPPPLRVVPYAAPSAFRDHGDGVHRPCESAPPGPPLIVSIARQDPRKGLDVLLRALAGLARTGTRFRALLVGKGPLLAAHRRLVIELGLEGLVDLPGEVEDVFTYLNRAQIFVLPSLEEGSGSVALLEALQAGTAVIASRCDGIPEDLRDGEDALLVEPGDVHGLERALAVLLENGLLRAQLAGHARTLFEERFSVEPFARALGDCYLELLSA